MPNHRTFRSEAEGQDGHRFSPFDPGRSPPATRIRRSAAPRRRQPINAHALVSDLPRLRGTMDKVIGPRSELNARGIDTTLANVKRAAED